MKIYIVLWKDRHTDTTAHTFTSFEEAKSWARKTAIDYCRDRENDYCEQQIEGWLFHVEYSGEGDCLWITEHEVE